jgi:alpha-L-fucosidase 2
VREVLGPRPIQSNFGDGVLSVERLAARLEIDVFRKALQIVFAPLRTLDFPLRGVDAIRLDTRAVQVGEADDGRDTQDRQPEHGQKRQIVLLADEPVPGKFASPDCQPDPDFAQQGRKHHVFTIARTASRFCAWLQAMAPQSARDARAGYNPVWLASCMSMPETVSSELLSDEPPEGTTRRDALKLGAAALIALGTPAYGAGESDGSSQPDFLRLWYRSPADEWVQALPIGNGRMGAMVFGGIALERLQLNEDTMWSGGPYVPANPLALQALPKVRDLIFNERFAEAEALAAEALMARPLNQMPYQPLAELLLSFPGLDWTTDYRRELDLDSAIARTVFDCEGVRHTREVLASAVDQVIIVSLAASKPGAINLDLMLTTPQPADTSIGHDDTLILRGLNRASSGIDGALAFETQVRVLATGGERSVRDGRLSVRHADEVTLLIGAATNYRNYEDVGGNPSAVVSDRITRSAAKSYARLREDHVAEYQSLFRRVALELPHNAEAAAQPTDERVRNSPSQNDPGLARLYFQYGRYLLISSSRPGTQPANLQGIWNDRVTPPWGSKYTININTEMNYWPAESTNLAECVQPLVAMVRDLARTGEHIARVHYGARGWVAHHNTDLWRAAAPIDGPQGLWPTGGAWLCTHLWNHYDYGRDAAYLAGIYPLMKGAAEFFLDTLVQHPRHGWMVTNPSVSPENRHRPKMVLCAGPSMDNQILRDLFSQCDEAAKTLGRDPEFRKQLVRMRERLPPHQIGKAGQLQEWLDDWDMEVPEIHHRHVSHLYAVYPSSQINLRDTPELVAAARKSLEIRGDEATGWGIGWRLNLWARLGDGEHAHRILNLLLQPQRTYANLFDAHPPFQIDGNFGGTSGIVEMLMQSWGGEIHLLPALPAAWPDGSISGLRARGAVELTLRWRNGRLVEASMHSDRGGQYLLRYGARQLRVHLSKGKTARVGVDSEGGLAVA